MTAWAWYDLSWWFIDVLFTYVYDYVLEECVQLPDT